MQSTAHKRTRLLPEMEGVTARWYAKSRGSASQLAAWRRQAAELTASLPAGSELLEVAPGPGYFSIELARLGFGVTAVDISHTMVQITTENAERAGVEVNVRHGDAARLPFPDEAFDLVVCQAAFKNFPEPVRALDEMHRVLRPGGTAVIHDLRRDATAEDIAAEVRQLGIGPVNSAFTRFALSALKRRAILAADFERLAKASRFSGCTIGVAGVGLEVRLVRR
jgi:ubiquinone/menaquinone biosynthesis C-methylase UbiE